MSGGHWEYRGRNIEYDLGEMANDDDVRRRWPLISAAMGAVAAFVGAAEHEMDWDLSGDTEIKDDATFDRRHFATLLDDLLKAAPDEWFPRGKWATIQAIQGRAMTHTDAPEGEEP